MVLLFYLLFIYQCILQLIVGLSLGKLKATSDELRVIILNPQLNVNINVELK